ncbi:MAG: DinB family protein [Thermomicrobiales bacterium]
MPDNADTPLTVADLLERIDASWSALLATLEDLTDEQLEEPGAVGEWSVKNTLGHIGYWDDKGCEQVALALAGQPLAFDDFENMNQADHAARLGRTLAEERAAMHQAHAALVAAMEERKALDAAAIETEIADFTYEHYDDHAQDVRTWREQRGY